MDKKVENNTNQKPKIKSKKNKRHNSEILSINPIKINNQNQQTMIINDAMSREQMVVSQFSNQQNILPFQVNQMYTQPSPQPVIITNRAEYGVPQNPNIPYINNINIQRVNDNIIRLRGKTQEFTCPYCHKYMKTSTENKCNCGSCLIYVLIYAIPITLFFYFFCINNSECECKFECRDASDSDGRCCCIPTCCRCYGRDNTDDCNCCCDVEHYCPFCGKLIGTRNAWSDICPPCCCCCCCCPSNKNILNLNEINNNEINNNEINNNNINN